MKAELKPNVIFLSREQGWGVAQVQWGTNQLCCCLQYYVLMYLVDHLQCKVLAGTTAANGTSDSIVVRTTITSNQPCSLHNTWISSLGHLVVINEHEGCSADQNDSPQLLLHLQEGSCSAAAQGLATVDITGHPAESFDAFANLNLRLYRGPRSMPPGQDLNLRFNSSAADDQGSVSAESHERLLAEAAHSTSTGVKADNVDATKVTPPVMKSQPTTFWGSLGKRMARVLQMSRRSKRMEPSVAQFVLPRMPDEDQLGNTTVGRHLLSTGKPYA